MEEKGRPNFPDDCASRDSGEGTIGNQVYMITNEGRLRNVFIKHGNIRTQKNAHGRFHYDRRTPEY